MSTEQRDDALPKAVRDSQDLPRFLSRLSSAERFGCQAKGSDEGFSSIRIRLKHGASDPWEVRVLRAELIDGVPRIAYHAERYGSDEEEIRARRRSD